MQHIYHHSAPHEWSHHEPSYLPASHPAMSCHHNNNNGFSYKTNEDFMLLQQQQDETDARLFNASNGVSVAYDQLQIYEFLLQISGDLQKPPPPPPLHNQIKLEDQAPTMTSSASTDPLSMDPQQHRHLESPSPTIPHLDQKPATPSRKKKLIASHAACPSCATTVSSAWKRNQSQIVCNSCRQHFRDFGRYPGK
ncbi:hypothetical protein BDR26DRAFT_859541 [Obelidium mucronatum]|nr:hypothetical protein BDR26DRAFT_859541 [Obelidium mucronatum]